MRVIAPSVILLSMMLPACEGPPTEEGNDEAPESLPMSASLDRAADDLYQVLARIQAEHEVLFTSAAFPNDQAKAAARKWFRHQELDWEIVRCEYNGAKHKRTLSAAANFLHRSRFFVEMPSTVFSDWKKEPYVNLTKLEGLHEEYWVQAIKFGRLINEQFPSLVAPSGAPDPTVTG